MGLYEKMYQIMSESEGLEKNLQVGSGLASYKAIGESEVLNMLKPLFKKYKLIVFPVMGKIAENSSVWESEYNGKTETKTRNVTLLEVNFKIVDIETGESEMLVGFGNGADSQDKGSGKAFTYAYKTMLSKTFMLFSGEDSDNEHSDDIGVQKSANSNNQSQPLNKPKTDSSTFNRAIALTNLVNVAKQKGFNEAAICKKAGITEIKYIKNELIQAYTLEFNKLPDKMVQ